MAKFVVQRLIIVFVSIVLVFLLVTIILERVRLVS